MTRRVAMAVGDTAGHVMPALAVVQAFREAGHETDALFLAARGTVAARLLAGTGERVATVPASALARVGIAGRFAAIARLVPGIACARRLLAAAGSRLVIGSGGYASGCVLLAARTLRLRTAIVEPNATPGLANQLLSRVVDRGYFAYASAAAGFPAGRWVLTGAPVRPAIARRLASVTRVGPREPARVLVTGGSRGEHFFAARVPALLGRVARAGIALTVRQHAGSLDAASLDASYRSLGIACRITAFDADIEEAYLDADFVIARAGAGTLAELALAGLPSLLVPLGDAAADHQSANAKAFVDAGAALLARETAWDEDGLAARLAVLFGDTRAWRAMSDAARALAVCDAAARVVLDCEERMRGRW